MSTAPTRFGRVLGGRPVGRSRRRSLKAGAIPARWPLVGFLTVIALTAVFPLYVMLSSAFRTEADWDRSRIGLPTHFTFTAFANAWTGAKIPRYFVNSLVITSATVVISIVVAAMGGYAYSKLEWRGRRFGYFFTLAWIALPPVALVVPLYIEMAHTGLLNTYWSVIFLYVTLNTPFNTYLMAAFFRAVPDELVDAARIDGASVHQVFFRVMVPLGRAALATLTIFTVLYVWNEFLFALLFLTSDNVKPLTVGVLQLQTRFSANYPALMAGLLIATIPVVAVYLFFQRYLIRAVTAGAIK
jgi:ABC-type glycerol-3-phosphate transport system permease component